MKEKVSIEKSMWGFDYITMEKMKKECLDYPNDIPDYDTFHSKSDNLDKACKEFDDFLEDNEMWDVDPEASFNYGEKYENIEAKVNYNHF